MPREDLGGLCLDAPFIGFLIVPPFHEDQIGMPIKTGEILDLNLLLRCAPLVEDANINHLQILRMGTGYGQVLNPVITVLRKFSPFFTDQSG